MSNIRIFDPVSYFRVAAESQDNVPEITMAYHLEEEILQRQKEDNESFKEQEEEDDIRIEQELDIIESTYSEATHHEEVLDELEMAGGISREDAIAIERRIPGVFERVGMSVESFTPHRSTINLEPAIEAVKLDARTMIVMGIIGAIVTFLGVAYKMGKGEKDIEFVEPRYNKILSFLKGSGNDKKLQSYIVNEYQPSMGHEKLNKIRDSVKGKIKAKGNLNTNAIFKSLSAPIAGKQDWHKRYFEIGDFYSDPTNAKQLKAYLEENVSIVSKITAKLKQHYGRDATVVKTSSNESRYIDYSIEKKNRHRATSKATATPKIDGGKEAEPKGMEAERDESIKSVDDIHLTEELKNVEIISKLHQLTGVELYAVEYKSGSDTKATQSVYMRGSSDKAKEWNAQFESKKIDESARDAALATIIDNFDIIFKVCKQYHIALKDINKSTQVLKGAVAKTKEELTKHIKKLKGKGGSADRDANNASTLDKAMQESFQFVTSSTFKFVGFNTNILNVCKIIAEAIDQIEKAENNSDSAEEKEKVKTQAEEAAKPDDSKPDTSTNQQ